MNSNNSILKLILEYARQILFYLDEAFKAMVRSNYVFERK